MRLPRPERDAEPDTYFNSRIRVGCDDTRQGIEADSQHISTHASIQDATRHVRDFSDYPCISTHAPI